MQSVITSIPNLEVPVLQQFSDSPHIQPIYNNVLTGRLIRDRHCDTSFLFYYTIESLNATTIRISKLFLIIVRRWWLLSIIIALFASFRTIKKFMVFMARNLNAL